MSIELLLFSLIATILWSLSNVLDKFVVNIDSKDNYWGILNISIISIIPLFFILKTYFQISLPSNYSTLFIYFLIGISYFLATYFYLKSLHIAEATSVSILLKLSSIFILVGEITFLGGYFHLTEIFGIIFLIISSLIISIKSFKNLKINKAFWLMLVSSFFFAIRSLIADYIVNGEPINLYVWSIIGSILTASLVLIIKKKARNNTIKILKNYSKKQIFLVSASKNLSGIGILLYIIAIDKGSVTIVSFITSTQPIFVLTLVSIISIGLGTAKKKFNRDYSKKNSIKTLLSILLATIGIILLSI